MRNKSSTNEKQSKADRAADVKMVMLIIALALVSFTTGYYFAMAEIAQAVLAN